MKFPSFETEVFRFHYQPIATCRHEWRRVPEDGRRTCRRCFMDWYPNIHGQRPPRRGHGKPGDWT